MAISKEVSRIRQDKILNALQRAQTISQLKLTMLDEYEMHITDSTIRRDIRELQSFGQVQLTGALSGREPLYVSATGFNMPQIYNPLTNVSYHPLVVQLSYGEGWRLMNKKHHDVWERSLNEVLNYARLRSLSDEFSYQDELNAIRVEIQKSISALLTYTKVLEQFLAQKVWWDDASIANVTTDVQWDSETVFFNYSKGLDQHG